MGVSCAETHSETEPASNPAEETASTTFAYDIEIWKDEHAGCPADPDAGAEPVASADAGADAHAGAPVDVLPAVRQHVRSCYDDLLAQNPEAQGQLVEQLWFAPNGDVCAIRPTLRIGLAKTQTACVEKLLRPARFENVPSPLYVPLTYAQKRRGAAYGPPSRIAGIHGCGKTVATPTEATFSYTSDASGKVADLKVDPWKGDQAALECAANAVTNAPHPASMTFVANIKFHP
jgi:hypothetical protein